MTAATRAILNSIPVIQCKSYTLSIPPSSIAVIVTLATVSQHRRPFTAGTSLCRSCLSWCGWRALVSTRPLSSSGCSPVSECVSLQPSRWVFTPAGIGITLISGKCFKWICLFSPFFLFFCAFQETAVADVHRAGALLFFVSGVVYMILQCVISRYTSPFGASVNLCRVRVGITVIAGLAFLPSILQGGGKNKLSFWDCLPSIFSLFTLLNWELSRHLFLPCETASVAPRLGRKGQTVTSAAETLRRL